jgi:hypothetical protein
MTVKPWVGFISKLPDDQIENGQHIAVFGGRNVAVAVGELMTGLGCTVSSPEYAAELGWEFDLYYGERHRFWCRITSFHPAFHLLFEDPATTRSTAAKNAAAYADLAQELAAALEADGRFREITWSSKKAGPPEPDEIGTKAARAHAGAGWANPIETPEDASRQRRPWGCLAFALWVTISGAIGLVLGLPHDMQPASGEMIGTGIIVFGVGVVGFLAAFVRRVD